MARIRTIKPEFFTSEDIVGLCPMARLLYIALWCEADREGRLMWKPRTFKMRYFPADDCDIEALCAELLKTGLVKAYGEGLAYIPKFGQHQHLNPRETASTLADPHAITTRATRVSTRVSTVHARDSDAQGGREGKGRECIDDASPTGDGQVASPIVTIPLNDGTGFDVTGSMLAEFTTTYPAVDVVQELREMRAWCLAKPERRKTKRGVMTFIVGWLGRAQDKGPSKNFGVNRDSTEALFDGVQ